MTIGRKLDALGYPEKEPNLNDEKSFRDIILWLEKNKIKKSKDNKLYDQAKWPSAYEDYKKLIQCPVNNNKRGELDWFLGFAIQEDFVKNSDKYNKHAVDKLKKSNVPNVIADNPLDNLDFNSKEFSEGIKNLARILKISPHSDPLLTLEACTKIIQKRLHQKAIENPNQYILKGTPFPYENADLGFDLGDPVLNKAAKVLRLLYIHDLRNLQTSANEVIVAVQSVTANPKTDTKLGKVGK